jgi:hypothetical protein
MLNISMGSPHSYQAIYERNLHILEHSLITLKAVNESKGFRVIRNGLENSGI